MNVVKLIVGQLSTNCYIVADSDRPDCIIIDPGDDAAYISEKIIQLGLKPKLILATHGHFDHIAAVGDLQLIFKVPFYMNKKDLFLIHRLKESVYYFLGYKFEGNMPVVDKFIDEKFRFKIGKTTLTAYLTPGHTPGSMTFYTSLNKAAFVGDLIFKGGSVGRTDFKYSSNPELLKSINIIMKLPSDTKLFCGHDDSTEVAFERKFHNN